MSSKKTSSHREKVKNLAGWLKHRITRQRTSDGDIFHPAAAPLGTDQEAGGSRSTPEGERLYDKEYKIIKPYK